MDVNNMELAVDDVNLPKVKAAVAKAIATKNLSIINKTAAELEDLTGFFKKLNIDHDILVALIKQLRLLIEQEIELRYLENLKFMSEVDAQEKKQDEELRRNRELEQEAVSRYRKESDLEYHKKLAALKVAIELQKEQFYKAQQIQAAKRRVIERDEKIRQKNTRLNELNTYIENNDALIKEHDNNINTLETQIFDKAFIDTLHSLNKTIPIEELHAVIDKCKHINNPDWVLNDIIKELAEVLEVDITAVTKCFTSEKSEISEKFGIEKAARKKLNEENTEFKKEKVAVTEEVKIFELANTIDKEFISTSTSPTGLVSDVEHDLVTQVMKENPELNSISRKEINHQIKESALEEIVEEAPDRLKEIENELIDVNRQVKSLEDELIKIDIDIDTVGNEGNDTKLDSLFALQETKEKELADYKFRLSQLVTARDLLKSKPEEIKNQLNEAWNKNVGNIGIIAPRPSWMKHREENKLSPAKNEEALSENEDKFGETNDL